MSVQEADGVGLAGRRFEHDALLYAGVDDFLENIGAFVRSGFERGDRVVVATDAVKGAALAESLGADDGDLTVLDMAEIGANPARIIPVWREILDAAIADGRSVTGVGEPIWAERSPDQLVECQHHEALLNLAFENGIGWSLLCPYDTTQLAGDVIEEALRSHRGVFVDASRHESDAYLDSARATELLASPLSPPPDRATVIDFAGDALSPVRDAVLVAARAAGLRGPAVEDVGLAVHELATNSVRHGGGSGVLRTWTDPHTFVAEIADGGHLRDPLVGRARPDLYAEGGRGLWMVNQLCDLAQVRSSERGTVVRVHMFL